MGFIRFLHRDGVDLHAIVNPRFVKQKRTEKDKGELVCSVQSCQLVDLSHHKMQILRISTE